MTDDHTHRGDDVHSVEAAEREANVGWQPIETAPRDGAEFDGWRDGERVTNVYFNDRGVITKRNWHGKFATWTNFDPRVPFTHWMPLPAAPTEGERCEHCDLPNPSSNPYCFCNRPLTPPP
jgi:hypothetical protein